MSLLSVISQLVPSGSVSPLVVDCGSAITKVAYKGKLVWHQPTIVAIDAQTDEFVSVGSLADQQLSVASTRSLKAVLPVKNGLISHFPALHYYLTQLLKQITWVDGSKISAFVPVILLEPFEPPVSAHKQWEKLAASLGRKTRLIAEQTAISSLSQEILPPTWLIDFGYSHTTCAFSGENTLIGSKIPWGVSRLTDALARSTAQQNILLAPNQLEMVLQQMNIMPSAESQTKKRKIGLTVKQLSTGASVRMVLKQEDLATAVTKIIVEWLWLVRQHIFRLASSVDQAQAPTKFYFLGGGSLLRGLAQKVEQELCFELQPGLTDQTSLAQILSKNYER